MESLGGISPRATHERTYITMNKFNLKAFHASIANLFGAFKATTKAEGSECKAMVVIIKTAPLNDTDAFKAICDDVFVTFGETNKDAAQKRVNILRNSRRVAHGGMKDGKAVKGKGVPFLLALCEEHTSINALKSAIAEEVPAGLKGKSGGTRANSGKGKVAGKTIANLPKNVSAKDAFAAAVRILEFIRTKFVKPSEVESTEIINKAIAVCADHGTELTK